MFPIVQGPGGKLYLWDARTNGVTAFDGTPYEAPPDVSTWSIVGYVRCLFDWQEAMSNVA